MSLVSFIRNLSLFIISFSIISCSSSDEPIVEGTLINANDFNITISENPDQGAVIGKIEATSNKSNLSFSLDSQSPNASVNINSQTGELRVSDKSKFNFETNNLIQGTVKITSEDITKNVNFKINITDLIEPTEYTFIDNSNTDFDERYRHRSVVFKDKIWVIGGNVKNNGRTNDILTTTDGQNWEKVAATGDVFPKISNHAITVFNEKIWVIGGYNSGESNGIWYSENGIKWVKSDKKFPIEIGIHEIIVFNNKIWVYGGYNGWNMLNKVWSSSDGENWQEVTNSNFPSVAFHDMITFDNKVWLIGGYRSEHFNDVWSSNDGINWTKKTTSANIFSPRSSHQVVTFLNKIWVIGGIYHENQSARALNEIWSSTNGIDWTKENITTTNTTSNYFNIVFNHRALIYKDKIWVLGGQISSSGYGISKVWHSN